MKAAFEIYSKIVDEAHRDYVHPRERRAMNRLGMMYSKTSLIAYLSYCILHLLHTSLIA